MATIDANLVRSLCAQRESPRLDFKRAPYAPASDKAADKAELVKDIMAMANAVPNGASPGYILVGVDEGPDKLGLIVGVNGAHPDDADFHDKLKHWLNRVPQFSYSPVDVNGKSVGVIQIVGGARPYFPIRETAGLSRHVAIVRIGSSSDVASPDQILEWAQEDNPTRHELEVLALKRAKVEQTPRPVIKLRNLLSANMSHVRFDVSISNHGEPAFTVTEAAAIWGININYRNEAGVSLAALQSAIGNKFLRKPLEAAHHVKPGSSVVMVVTFELEDFAEYCAQAGLRVPDRFLTEWLTCKISARCVTPGRKVKVATLDIDLPPTPEPRTRVVGAGRRM